MSAQNAEYGVQHPAINVTRVVRGHGSSVEPPLDPSWDALTKLRWHAGAVAYDTGLEIAIYDGAKIVAGKRVPGSYGVCVGGGSIASFNFSEVWAFLNGVNMGARAERRNAVPNDGSER